IRGVERCLGYARGGVATNKVGSYIVSYRDIVVRMPRPPNPKLIRYALRIQERSGVRFLFSAEAGEIARLARAQPLGQGGDGAKTGYGRLPNQRHIRSLSRYYASVPVPFVAPFLLMLPHDATFVPRGRARPEEPATP